MNHVPSRLIAAEARPMTRRALAKLRTRKALLEAGKQLFTERGYEDATVRDIARAADLSTGAVFANFSDKADLFAEILAADDDSLSAVMRPLAQVQGGVRAVLTAVLTAGYEFHMDQLPLLQAAQAVAWSPPKDAGGRLGQDGQAVAIVAEVLSRGVAAGELSARTDVDLVADLVWQAYLSNFRLAAFDGAALNDVVARLEGQLDLILGGLKV